MYLAQKTFLPVSAHFRVVPMIFLLIFFAVYAPATPAAAAGTPPTISSIANQLININKASSALAFTVSDRVTPVASLMVTGVSDKPTLFPTIRIVFSGAGATRSVTVTPTAGQTGTATITLTVKNSAGLTAKTSFAVTVNAAPTITPIANQLINMGTSSSALAFTVGDDLTPIASLAVSCTSSNTALVKAAGIVLTGANAQGVCALTLSPVTTYSGQTTILLTVTDAGGLTAKTTFVLTVNGKPTITSLLNQQVSSGMSSGALPFTVADVVTPVASLTVTATSSNTTLLPASNIIIAGTGAARTVTVTPVSAGSGVATITLTVKDGGGLTAATSFTLTVQAPPSAANDTWSAGTNAASGNAYTIFWSDEFNKTGIDNAIWGYDTTANGWSNSWNNEWQDYTDNGSGGANAYLLNDGTNNRVLVLKAIRSSNTNAMHAFTSARLSSSGKVTVPMGTVKVAARIALPYGNGIWPAFWMLGTNGLTWPANGEIDAMEMIGGQTGANLGGGDKVVYGTLHWPAGDYGIHTTVTTPGAFHVYWFERNIKTNMLTIGIDNTPYFQMDISSQPLFSNQTFYLILNLAVGGNWPGYPDATTVFPQYMYVDWVRVYK